MIKKIFNYCKIAIASSPRFFLINFLVILLLSFVHLGRNYSLKWITEQLILSQNTLVFNVSVIYPLFLYAVLIILGGDTANFTTMLYNLFTKNAKKIFVRNFMYKSYVEKQDKYYDSNFYDNYEFVKKNIDNTTKINETIFNNFCGTFLRLLINVAAVAFFSLFVALLLIVLATIIVTVNRYVVKEQIKIGEKIINDERKANYFSWLLSSKEHAKELRIFRLRSFLFKKWKSSYNKFVIVNYKLEKKSILLNSISTLSMHIFTTVMTIYFLSLVNVGSIDASGFVFLQTMMWSLTWSITGLIDILSGDLLEKYSYLNKYDAYIDKLESNIPLITSTLSESRNQKLKFCCLECRDLSYTYPNRKERAVSNINLKISKGEIICILGYNGSGKTTLSKLICGILENYDGQIIIDGLETSSINREDMYRYFGVGFQEFTKYSLTVKENIGIGKIEDLSNETEIKKAVYKGNLKKLIDSLPKGLDTQLGKDYNPNGVELSGGQWQKIIISRAFMGEPEILIFDEPTASIDPIEEMKMLEHFQDLVKNKTAIFISHRIGFALIADRILYMENGRIIEEGSHDDLLKLNRKYAQIFKSQQSLYMRKGEEDV